MQKSGDLCQSIAAMYDRDYSEIFYHEHTESHVEFVK